MRAVVCRELRGPDALELADLPVPEPGACGVRIRVRAAGVNFADSLMLAGPLPGEAALAVHARPRARRARSRPSVPACAASRPGSGCWRWSITAPSPSRRVARAEDVVPLPDEMDDVTAAGFAIAYGTAHGALRWRADLHAGETSGRPRCRRRRRPDRGRVRQGDRCHGDRHRARRGKARGGPRARRRPCPRQRRPRPQGPHPRAHRRPRRRRGLRSGRRGGVRRLAARDRLGGADRHHRLRLGRGAADPGQLLLVKNAAVLGFYWGSYRKHDPERLRDGFKELFAWHRDGRIRPHVSQTLPLARAADAIRLLADRRAIGKVVVHHAP